MTGPGRPVKPGRAAASVLVRGSCAEGEVPLQAAGRCDVRVLGVQVEGC